MQAQQNEHEAKKTLYTIQDILNNTDWDRVKSKNVLNKFERVWDQLEDVRLGYAYKRRQSGPIKALKSLNITLSQTNQQLNKNVATLKSNQKVYHDEQKRLERVIEQKNRDLMMKDWDIETRD